MTNLPLSGLLPIESLSACFQNTTNSYKFYWFIAILDYIRTHRTHVIPVDDLKSNMIASIWYPTVYFNLSFGKQDRLSLAAIILKDAIKAEFSANQEEIVNKIAELRKTSREFNKEFNELGRYVPYRFLEPFFRNVLSRVEDHRKNGLIVNLATESFTLPNTPSLYKLREEKEKKIEIHLDWYSYLQQHLSIKSAQGTPSL